MLQDLNSRTIGDLDNGLVGAMIDHALAAAIRDVDDRGEQDAKPRKVVIEIFVTKPRRAELQIEAQVRTNVPAYRSNITSAVIDERTTKNGVRKTLKFRDDNAENPDQPTFTDLNTEE